MPPLDLHRYLAALWRWSWFLLLAAALGAFVSYQVVRRVPPTFVSSTTLMVGEPGRNPRPSDSDLATAQHLAQIYAQMAQRQLVLEATVKELNLPTTWEELRRRVVVLNQRGSQLVEIRVVDFSPERARAIAATIARQLIDASPTTMNRIDMEERRQFIRDELDALQGKIQRGKEDLEKARAALAKETSARGVLDRQDEIKALELNINTWRSSYSALLTASGEGAGPNMLTVIEPASLPDQPAGPNALWNVALAALAGLVLAAAGVLALEFLDNTIRARRDLETILGEPSIGQLPRLAAVRPGVCHLVVRDEPDSVAAEAYRALAVNLNFASPSLPGNVVLITSAMHGEGKSMTAANVAAALAMGGKSVVLADLDLRNPSLHTLLGVSNERGATRLLSAGCPPTPDCLLDTPVENLKLLPSGPVPPNPAELLSRHGGRLIEGLRELADLVIVDAPPLLAVADATMLAGLVDGAVLVARSGQTHRDSYRTAREMLERTRVRLVGGLLNGVPRSELVPYGYQYPRPRLNLAGRRWLGRALLPPRAFPEP